MTWISDNPTLEELEKAPVWALEEWADARRREAFVASEKKKQKLLDQWLLVFTVAIATIPPIEFAVLAPRLDASIVTIVATAAIMMTLGRMHERSDCTVNGTRQSSIGGDVFVACVLSVVACGWALLAGAAARYLAGFLWGMLPS